MRSTIKNIGTKFIGLVFAAAITFAFTLTGCPTPDDGGGERILTGITVTLPTEIRYKQGEDVDFSVIIVNAVYSDGSRELLDYDKLEISGYDKTKTGNQTITVSYNGKTANFSITDGVKTLESIRINALPVKTRYNLGENLDIDGMVVTAAYAGGSKEIIDYDKLEISGYNNAQTGNQTITVSYKGKTAEFSVNVINQNLKTAETPTASPKAGIVFGGATAVTLYTVTADAEIWYTTNGAIPAKNGADSLKYETPFDITPPVTVKAISFKDNMNDSSLLVAEYSLPTELSLNTWADGESNSNDDAQLFMFTATSDTQYIHVSFGTLSGSYGVWIQLYDSDGGQVGNEQQLYSGNSYIQRNVTKGAVYYVKVRSTNSSSGGTYKIAFSESKIPAATARLTLNTWTDGVLLSSSDEQWFRFTATSDTQYIYASVGSASYIYVQAYNSEGYTIGSQTYLTNSYVSLSVIVGQTYYIRVWSNTGTYKITFTASSTAPQITLPSSAIRLTENTWTDGNLPTSSSEQWFRFSATATFHYIHAGLGTLNGLGVEVYDTSGNIVRSRSNLSGDSRYSYAYVTIGQEYYIRAVPYSGNGTYKIAFSTSATAPQISLPSNAIRLSLDTWADGNIPTSTGAQWFRFTAAENSQYIHANFGTLADINVQVYNTSGESAGGQINLSGSTKSVSRSLTAGQEYYIRVVPNSGSGAYKIAFSTAFYPPATTITGLSENIWAEGNLPTYSDVAWFKFTATAPEGTSQYIFMSRGTLNYLTVYVYKPDGALVANLGWMGNSGSSVSVTEGDEYYIKAVPSSSDYRGTYKIAFSTSNDSSDIKISLPANATTLTANTWENGNITASSPEKWFKFTATLTGQQYIHFNFGTLNYLSVQVYDSNGDTVGSQTQVYYYSNTYLNRTVTEGETYYIKVSQYSDYTGTYQITINASSSKPLSSNATNGAALSENTWADGNLSSTTTEQWFKFTATVTGQQYIHAGFGTLNPSYGLYVQVYNSSGATVGYQQQLYYYTRYVSTSVTTGQLYYIRVWPSNSNYTGTYKIGFTKSQIQPVTATLAEDTWADGNLPTGYDEQWFKFTATTSPQYIYASFGTLYIGNGVNVQVYNSSGATVVSQQRLYSSTPSITLNYLTEDEEYYIKVSPYNNSANGTYQIALGTTTTTPSTILPTATTLTVNRWTYGNLPASTDVQWFKFTATVTGQQYIHVSFGTLNTDYGVNVQMYDSDGNAVPGGQTTLTASSTYLGRTVTTGQTYYIRVLPYSSSYTGTYRIAFTESSTAP